MNAFEGIAGLLIAVASSVILGIAFLLIIYKLIDGDFPLIPGLAVAFVVVFMLLMCVKPIHPVIPAIILVVTLTIMTLFPYAATQLETAELRAIDTAQLEKSYAALKARPDNVAAIFEVARSLYVHGMKGHAIGLASKTLQALSGSVDPVSNRSLRDQFRSEEYAMKRWMKEVAADPASGRPIACPHCGFLNPVDEIVCRKCNEAYVLTLARSLDVRKRFIGRLLLAAAAIAGLIVVASTIGLYLGGIAFFASMVAAVAGTGIFIHVLFRPPQLARQ